MTTRPTETLPGEVIFAMLYSQLTELFGMPASGNWKRIDSATVPCSTSGRVDWAYYVATALDPASFSFPISATTYAVDRTGILISYRGVAVTGPNGSQTAAGESGPTTLPSIKTTADRSLLIAAFAVSNESTAWTAPPGMDTQKVIGRLAIFDKLQPTAGATGPETAISGEPCWTGAAIAFGPRELCGWTPRSLSASRKACSPSSLERRNGDGRRAEAGRGRRLVGPGREEPGNRQGSCRSPASSSRAKD